MKKLVVALLLGSFFLGSGSFLFCAAPLFHAMIADKWLKTFENYNEDEKQAFMIGTLFPDIRYLAHLPRSSTHEYHLSIQEIRATKDPFLKGMRVHAFVDEQRERYLKDHPIGDVLKDFPGNALFFLKMVEDEILYPSCDKELLISVCSWLQTVEKGETDFNISFPLVQEWHVFQKCFFECRQSELFQELANKHEPFHGIPEKTIVFLSVFLPKYRENEIIKKNTFLMFEEFNKLFSVASIPVTVEPRNGN